jgi:hypothetical protein
MPGPTWIDDERPDPGVMDATEDSGKSQHITPVDDYLIPRLIPVDDTPPARRAYWSSTAPPADRLLSTRLHCLFLDWLI